jgi:uncharacterized surface protein with fasciclin (FAS1) repeats
MIRRIVAIVVLAAATLTVAAPAMAAQPNIVQRAIAINQATGQFDTLLAAATCSYFGSTVVDVLSSPDKTLFAPTDRAFDKLGLTADNVCATFAGNSSALLNILTYHVVDARVSVFRLLRSIGGSITMLNGQQAAVTWDWGIKVDGARVVLPNIPASNGFIHVVSSVLLP